MMIERIFITILGLFFLLNAEAQIWGKIQNAKGEPLAYVSVYDSSYRYSAISNESGYFDLKIPESVHLVYFQLLGYETQTMSLDGGKSVKELLVTLAESSYILPEINVGILREDPAIPIMRKAIKNRDINSRMIAQYTSTVYGKALVKLVDAPEKVMGRPVADLGGMLDSARQGVVYLSETVSEVSFKAPDKFKEKIIASKVSGDASGFSLNSFSRSNINFYDESIDFDRAFIGPLNDRAFAYYNFVFVKSFFDEKGHTINEILVEPKSKYTPCFTGYIYIAEDMYNIHSLDLTIHKDALKSVFLNDITIRQLYKPLKDRQWMIFSQNLTFNIGVFGFKAAGYSNYLFLEQNLSPGLTDRDFNAETLLFTDDASAKDSVFWESTRPLPLTIEEVKDYKRKDSLEIYWKSKPFLDSIDMANNKFSASDLFFGYRASKSEKEITYGVNSLVNNFHFNPVEGFNVQLPVFLRNVNTDKARGYFASAFLKYGFADQRLKFGAKWRYDYNENKLSYFGLLISDHNEHFNEIGGISDLAVTFQALRNKLNPAKFYRRKYVQASWRTELLNGVLFRLTSSIEARNSLLNQSQYSFRNRDLVYQPNNIRNASDYFFEDKLFLQSFNFRFRIGQMYTSYPNRRVRMRSEWPDIFFTYQWAVPLTSQYADYSKIILRLEKQNIPMSIYGYGNAVMEYGSFLSKKRFNDVDLFHFQGNELSTAFVSNYLNGYRLLPYYQFSSDRNYLTAFYEHHFDGFLTDLIPYVNRTGIKLVANAATLLRTDKRYYEVGLGLEGFTLGPFDLFRFDYIWSFSDGAYLRGGFKIGLGEIFERDTTF